MRIIVLLLSLSAAFSALAESLQIIPSERALFSTPKQTSLSQLVAQLYPQHQPWWSTIETALIRYNPQAFDARQRLIPGKRLQLVKLQNVAQPTVQNTLSQERVVGRVLSAWGVVMVYSQNGVASQLQNGDQVFEGDRISTQQHASSSIEMKDGAVLHLRANSTVDLKRYHYPGSAQQPATSTLALIRGGLRKITGLIAKQQPARYQLNVATVTIGVRGTDFVAQICQQQDCGQLLAPFDDGATLHTAVLDGSIALHRQQQLVGEVDAGESGVLSAEGFTTAQSPAEGLLNAAELQQWQALTAEESDSQSVLPWILGALLLGLLL